MLFNLNPWFINGCPNFFQCEKCFLLSHLSLLVVSFFFFNSLMCICFYTAQDWAIFSVEIVFQIAYYFSLYTCSWRTNITGLLTNSSIVQFLWKMCLKLLVATWTLVCTCILELKYIRFRCIFSIWLLETLSTFFFFFLIFSDVDVTSSYLPA